MRALAISALLLMAPISGAAETGTEASPQSVDVAAFPSPTVAPLTRLAIGISGVCAIGLALSLWARRRRATLGGETARIQVLASRSVGPRHQVALISVGERRLLIGMGADSVTTLADLTVETTFAEELAKSVPAQPDEGDPILLGSIGSFEGLDA